MVATKKVGLFGGTFNPIHLGHLRGAEEIRESLGLERVIFIPAAIPPHKEMADVIEPLARLEMVRLATAANPFFSVSDVELRRSGKSYTIGTLRYFHEKEGDSLFFIVGKEAFAEIETWKEYGKLFSLSNFIVMAPTGFGKTPPSSRLPKGLASSFHYDHDGGYWRHESGHTLHFQEIAFLDISSTRIRELIGRGKSLKYLVPSEVETYIQSHGLYRGGRVAGEGKNSV